MKLKDRVIVIGGNNEIDQPTMIGKVGVVADIIGEVIYVDFKYFGRHCFNDYHLKKL